MALSGREAGWQSGMSCSIMMYPLPRAVPVTSRHHGGLLWSECLSYRQAVNPASQKGCLQRMLHGGPQGPDRHIRRGRGQGPGRIQSPAHGLLAVQPQGSPLRGGRPGASVSRQACPSYRLSGQKRSQQQCGAGRLQGQVIQSHKVAGSESSGRQESEPRSACREPLPRAGRPASLLNEAFLLRLLRACEEDTRLWAGPGQARRPRDQPALEPEEAIVKV